MTDTPLWQQQRDAMQAEAQAAAPLETPAWGAQGTETRKFALADYPNPYNPLGEWYTVGEPGPTQPGVPPPLTRAQIAQDLARYGHDPSVLLREWDTYTQRIGQGPPAPPLSDAECALGGPDLTIAERAAIRRLLREWPHG